MTKKLILLTLALPLVLMICLFALTKTVGQAIDAPVTGIEVVGKKVVYLNLDESESYTLNYSVFPTSAKNKDVTIAFGAIEGKTLAKIEYEMFEDGRVVLTPKAAGAAKVTLRTVDGGFEDGITVYVESDKCTGVRLSAEKTELTVGESLMLSTEFIPVAPKDERLSFVSSNPEILTVNDSGKIVALGRGSATVTVSLISDPAISDTLTFTVTNRDVFDFGSEQVTSKGATGSVQISMKEGALADAARFTYTVLDANGTPLSDAPLTVSFVAEGEKIVMQYTFHDADFVGEVVVRVAYAQDGEDPVVKDCHVSRVRDFSISFLTDAVNVGSTGFLNYELTPEDANVTYLRYSLSSDCVSIVDYNGRLTVIGDKAGTCTVTLYFREGEDGAERAFSHDILVVPKTFSIHESATTYGDENLLAIGGLRADGTASAHKLTLSANLAADKYGATFAEVFSFVAIDTDKVSVDGDGIIQFKDASFSGPVSFVARFDNGTARRDSAPFTVYCVASGIDVYSYEDLLYATEHERPAILQADIVEDFGYRNGSVVYTEMDTTYDKTHYENLKVANPSFNIPKIKVLLTFKNDLWGNGYTVNAGKVAYDVDGTGAPNTNALFRGPLNFVSMSESETSAISVKGQDNICFALCEGVSVRNVKLYGCTLEADQDGNIDLTDLTYTGTTVEVLGDNVDIAYSRIANGRTVLRAFGDVADATKPIHLNITNSVLSGSREFIMRLGSNCFKTGDYEDPAPKLDGANDETHNTKKSYNNLSPEQKQAYDEKFIKTFVTVKNSVFKDAGLFAVGMDSHFAGAALADGDEAAKIHQRLQGLLSTWKNLAKTSYGAKLTFEGDVRMYTWKKLDTIDSSSLIEVSEISQFKDLMNFDIKEMIGKIALPESEGGKGFTDIVTVREGINWVHAGIAFFGGGKNYGVFENNITDSTIGTVSNYSISFSDVDRHYMTAAAGTESFYFCLYNQKYGISVDKQQSDLTSPNGDAYAPIKIK